MPEDNMVGRRIRQARRAQDLTQQALGRRARVNYTTISRIENGDYEHLYVNIVVDLACALEVSLDWLYGRKDDCHV